MNRYDDFRPDVSRLLAEQSARLPVKPPGARSGDGLGPLARLASRLRLGALGLLVLSGWHRALMYSNLRLDWFEEFQRYWVEELGNRPLHPHDFYHLYGVYRQRLQSIAPDLASDASQLASWRDHRIVYYLFSHAYRQALSPLRVQRYARFLRRHGRVAEYGCGTAPITTALARHYRHLDLQLVGCRYCARPVPLRPLAVPGTCPTSPRSRSPPTTTRRCPASTTRSSAWRRFEHVPRPLAALGHFHTVLRPGGVLIFDYIRSEAIGLDTPAALRDREPALRLIADRFEPVEGRIALDGGDQPPTVVRKRG